MLEVLSVIPNAKKYFLHHIGDILIVEIMQPIPSCRHQWHTERVSRAFRPLLDPRHEVLPSETSPAAGEGEQVAGGLKFLIVEFVNIVGRVDAKPYWRFQYPGAFLLCRRGLGTALGHPAGEVIGKQMSDTSRSRVEPRRGGTSFLREILREWWKR